MSLINGDRKQNDPLALIEDEGMEFHFRPLTSGLGFEKINEKQEEFIKKQALQRQYRAKSNSRPLKINSAAIQRGKLAPFYHDHAVAPVPKITETPQEKQHQGGEAVDCRDRQTGEQLQKIEESGQLAKSIFRIFAYLVDFTIITFFTALTLLAIFFILNMDRQELIQVALFKSIEFYVMSTFIIYYLFYFTFMDSVESSSFGKSLMAIKVRNSLGEKAHVMQTLLRSILSLLDVALLGLPCLFYLKESLSETQVVRYSHE